MMGVLKDPVRDRAGCRSTWQHPLGGWFDRWWRDGLPVEVAGVLLGPNGPQDGTEGSGKSLEIDGRGREVRLDLHVVETAPHGAPEPVTGLRLAVEALRAPEVPLVQPLIARAHRARRRRARSSAG